MAEDNIFRNETLDEARERLKAMSDAEKAGFEAASEGQAVADRNPPELQERAAAVDERFNVLRDFHVEPGTNRPAAEGVKLLEQGGVVPAQDEPAADAGGDRPRRRRRARGAEGEGQANDETAQAE